MRYYPLEEKVSRSRKEAGETSEVTASVGTVTVEPLDHLEHYWQDKCALKWDCVFMLPPWLRAWWSSFGQGLEGYLYVVKQNDALCGVAPLIVRGDSAHLISDRDLIDYSDFIIAPLWEREFFTTLLDYLRRQGLRRLETGRVRDDSIAVNGLKAHSVALGCEVSCTPVDLLYEVDLPNTWEGYFALLSGKERHEVRRKIRRLESSGPVRLRVIEEGTDTLPAMDAFVTLFRSNRPEKAQFMSGTTESFFRSLAAEMAGAGLLKLFSLERDSGPAAMAMCFDYGSMVYLYNSAYDRHFSDLSVGLLCKVFSIRESIVRKRKKYNFLRGEEAYKSRLGGHRVKLYHCEVILK